MFCRDERNVVQAVDSVMSDGNDRNLDAEEVGDLSCEGALEAGEAHRDAHQADSPARARSRETEERDICRWRAIVSIVCPWGVVHRGGLMCLFVTYCHHVF